MGPLLAAAIGRLRARRLDAIAWCAEKSWPPRAALTAYLVYAGVRHLGDPMYRSVFGGITFGLHELGHILFLWAGRTMMFLGGSLTQIVAPLFAAWYLLLVQRDYFGFAVGGAWLSFSTWELATYVGDARAENLPVVGFSDQAEHDWNVLLGHWGILAWDTRLAALLRVAAFGIWLASTLLAAALCFGIWRAARSRQASASSHAP